tara:strand:- start:249 stop:551 length:303 start_codon:yes stop_codon:yes gene_type:complete
MIRTKDIEEIVQALRAGHIVCRAQSSKTVDIIYKMIDNGVRRHIGKIEEQKLNDIDFDSIKFNKYTSGINSWHKNNYRPFEMSMYTYTIIKNYKSLYKIY